MSESQSKEQDIDWIYALRHSLGGTTLSPEECEALADELERLRAEIRQLQTRAGAFLEANKGLADGRSHDSATIERLHMELGRIADAGVNFILNCPLGDSDNGA